MTAEAGPLLKDLNLANEREDLTEAFAEALALCVSPEAAEKFVAASERSPGASPDQQYGFIASTLARQHHPITATEIIASVEDPDIISTVGLSLAEAGDAAIAHKVASRALSIRLAKGGGSDLFDDYRLFQLLEEVHDFGDEARFIAATGDSGERVLQYSGLIHAALKEQDFAFLPSAIAAMLEDARPGATFEGNKYQALESAAEELALAHFPKEAQKLFDAWKANQTDLRGQPLVETESYFRATMGEGDEAIKLAESNGPLVDQMDQLSTMVVAGMALDGGDSLTAAQKADALKQALEASQRPGPGPGARALSMVATNLALAGNIPAALMAEARLEQNPSPALDSFRQQALANIALAQVKAGELEPALATCERSPDVSDLKALTALVAQPVPQ